MSGSSNNARLGAKNIWKTDDALGTVKKFTDKNHADPESTRVLSGHFLMAVYTKNTSGSNLDPGKGVVMKSGALNEVGGYHSANGRCDGVIDPYLSGAVANDDYFWLITEGPVNLEIGAGNIAANAVVQTIASGLFAGGTAGTNPLGHCGIAQEAANSGSRARCFFRNSFGIASVGGTV